MIRSGTAGEILVAWLGNADLQGGAAVFSEDPLESAHQLHHTHVDQPIHLLTTCCANPGVLSSVPVHTCNEGLKPAQKIFRNRRTGCRIPDLVRMCIKLKYSLCKSFNKAAHLQGGIQASGPGLLGSAFQLHTQTRLSL